MPFNGTGAYVLPTPAYPAIPDELILAESRNTIDEDIAAALSNCITADGQTAAPLLNAPTLVLDPVAGDNTSKVPTTRWVQGQIASPVANAASKCYAFYNFL